MSDLPIFLARCRVVAPVLLLAACAQHPARAPAPTPVQVPAYAAPGPAVAAAFLVMSHDLQPDDWYHVDLFANAERCAGRSRVGSGGHAVDPVPTRLAAGRWQTFETWVHEPRGYCAVRLSFAPAAGRTYAVTTKSNPDGSCTAMLRDVTDPDAVRIEPSLRQREAGNQACKTLATSAPLMVRAGQRQPEQAIDLPIETVEREPGMARPQLLPEPAPTVTADDLKGLTAR
ncbi:hypothetical protein [Scleromatobacter humisilvae]|uniref:Lipoprotein n=1 Tax=Scleromatobacter humisilvae TaxID=2897159 RepID=A0A9X2BZP2_9BURK|nr:hypothetical protein [Scleromatobacter humisilvae]MCK9685591.1 hypothetical protein [Scleromatobacter humisilvae]